MGGKALLQYGIKTERKNTNDFYNIMGKIAVRLTYGLGITMSIPVRFSYGTTLTSQTIKTYHTKPDHGDLDVLIKMDENFRNKKIELKKYVEETFHPNVIHNNSGVLSFDYESFQIDFIPIKECNWDIANVYYSYDPLGNIMGKTFHRFNLSYGWEGLYYKYRNFNGINSNNILLSKDPKKIFDFGGYDYEKYLNGFDTLEDIFKFVIDSKYFDAEMFQFKNLNQIDKKRNRKRASYKIFLEYLEKNDIRNQYLFDHTKENYIPLIDKFFPEANLITEMDKLKQIDEINRSINEKFNGKIVMEWLPELQGKELGAAITKFKKVLDDKYEDFILFATPHQIHDKFMEIYNDKHGS